MSTTQGPPAAPTLTSTPQGPLQGGGLESTPMGPPGAPTTPTPFPTETPSPSSVPLTSTASHLTGPLSTPTSSSHAAIGPAVGGTVGGVAGISVLIFAIVCVRRRRRRRQLAEIDAESKAVVADNIPTVAGGETLPYWPSNVHPSADTEVLPASNDEIDAGPKITVSDNNPRSSLAQPRTSPVIHLPSALEAQTSSTLPVTPPASSMGSQAPSTQHRTSNASQSFLTPEDARFFNNLQNLNVPAAEIATMIEARRAEREAAWRSQSRSGVAVNREANQGDAPPRYDFDTD